MDELGAFLPILTGILAITTIVAAVFGGLMLGTRQTLRDSNKDLRDRVTDLEAERTEMREERAEDRTTMAEQSAKISILESLVQGRVEWTAISDQLEELTRVLAEAGELISEHDRKAGNWWDVATDHLQKIESLLAGEEP